MKAKALDGNQLFMFKESGKNRIFSQMPSGPSPSWQNTR